MQEREITAYLRERGADLVGFAAADIWDEDDRTPEAYRPKALWPKARSVIVIGMAMPLPIVETTPSVQHRDLYNACNRSLDDLAFDLARRLARGGCAAIHHSRDGYANINVLIKNPRAAFSHTLAAYYAGLGYIGLNNTVLTREFGPRVRFVSVFTEAVLSGSPPPGNASLHLMRRLFGLLSRRSASCHERGIEGPHSEGRSLRSSRLCALGARTDQTRLLSLRHLHQGLPCRRGQETIRAGKSARSLPKGIGKRHRQRPRFFPSRLDAYSPSRKPFV